MIKPEKYINDPVYGGIPVSNIELKLINTAAFQRLRGLRQLGRVDYVFPGAEHSRFIHSLGVLYIMQLMTRHLVENEYISELDAKKMRVAALLHDIGHYPLSHLGESVYGYCVDNEISKNLVKTIAPLEVDSEQCKLYQLASSHSKSAHHEQLGKYVVCNCSEIRSILESDGLDPEEIGSIFTGEIGSQKMIYSQLLHSSLDADRLDYLLRDSYQTGVRYGHVDLEYIVRLLMVVDDQNLIGDDKKTLAFSKKGQHVVEHFLMSRYFHYSQIIFHKTNAAFEGLVKVLYIKLLQANKFLYNSLTDIHDNINSDKFIGFNDANLELAFRDYFDETQDSDFKTLYDMYSKRIRPKTVFNIKELYDNAPCAEFNTLKWILKRTPEKITEIIGSEKWGYQIVPLSVERIQGEYSWEDVRKVNPEELREAIKLYDIDARNVSYLAADKLSVINKLSNYKSEFIRVFVLEDKSEEEYNAIYQSIKALIQS